MNSVCLLDFVRVSSPEHYDVHPLWKYFKYDSNVTCEELSKIPLEEYFKNMYVAGYQDHQIFYAIFLSITVGIFVYGSSQVIKSRRFSFGGALTSVVLAFCQGSLYHLLCHYQNDLSHINGNVMHHSSYTVEGHNSALVGTIPPGLLYNFIQNYLTVWGMAYVIFRYLKLDFGLYSAVAAILMPAKLLVQMKIIHPYIHSQHKNWIPYPINLVYDDYGGHVLCHHVSGYCLGDMPGLGLLFDPLFYIHGQIYKHNLLKFGTPAHYTFNILLDYLLLAMIFSAFFILIRVLKPILLSAPKAAESIKQN
jgi:hypothetical protein